MKIGFFYSIFSAKEVDKSISYILCLAKNIDTLKRAKDNAKKFGDTIDMIINCDRFTEEVINMVCKNEGIDTRWVKFHIHRRNMGLRGMFWRFECFYADEYDVAISCEGDYEVSAYYNKLEYFASKKYPLMVFDVRQFKINKNAIAAGMFFVRPKMLKQEVKKRIKTVLPLFDHIDDIDYGVDEHYFINFIVKHFSDERILVIADHKHNIFQRIENVEEEKAYLRTIFKGADVCDINWLESHLGKRSKYFVPQKKDLKYQNGNTYTVVEKKKTYTINPPLRVERSSFCQNNLMNIIKDII